MKHLLLLFCTALPALPHTGPAAVTTTGAEAIRLPDDAVLAGAGVLLIGALRHRER